jgi:hypothetical protein
VRADHPFSQHFNELVHQLHDNETEVKAKSLVVHSQLPMVAIGTSWVDMCDALTIFLGVIHEKSKTNSRSYFVAQCGLGGMA